MNILLEQQRALNSEETELAEDEVTQQGLVDVIDMEHTIEECINLRTVSNV